MKKLPLKKIITILRKNKVVVAYLFGSHAHRTAGPLSDIDLAVIFRLKSKFKHDRYLNAALRELQQLLATDQIDLIDLSEVNSPLLKHRAVFFGQCLFCDDELLRFATEHRIMQEYEDTCYLRNTQMRLMRQRLRQGTFGKFHQHSPYLEKVLRHHHGSH